jgi:hypothetical protein
MKTLLVLCAVLAIGGCGKPQAINLHITPPKPPMELVLYPCLGIATCATADDKTWGDEESFGRRQNTWFRCYVKDETVAGTLQQDHEVPCDKFIVKPQP